MGCDLRKQCPVPSLKFPCFPVPRALFAHLESIARPPLDGKPREPAVVRPPADAMPSADPDGLGGSLTGDNGIVISRGAGFVVD
jgi:hypothetical protein